MGKIYPCSHGTYLHICAEQEEASDVAGAQIPTLVIEQMARVRETGETNLFSIYGVEEVAVKYGWMELFIWLTEHYADYTAIEEVLDASASVVILPDGSASSRGLEQQ